MAMASQTYSRISTMMAASAPVKRIDRKSTRLNSSHSQISYAVFCLKKKKTNNNEIADYSQQYLVTKQLTVSVALYFVGHHTLDDIFSTFCLVRYAITQHM